MWHGSLAGRSSPALLMLPRFADIFQQGNRWLNWLEKQPEGSVRPVVIESVTKIMACGTEPPRKSWRLNSLRKR
ncbi:putative transposase [Escherichia coli PA42]|nr:putative transposase [Escherichia coli PA42]